jgi:hypothetical protein
MNTLAQIRSVVQSDLNAGANSSLYPSARIDSAINRSYIKSARLFRWPALEDAKKTSTAINQDYYDFPQNWSPDSVWRVEIDGLLYGETPDGSPLTFEDFLIWRTENPNSALKKWAVQYKRYFVTPTPTTVGDNNICIYGQKNITELSDDADETIWSHDMPECNEAVALEATSILKRKGEIKGDMYSEEAKQILVIAFNKIKQEQMKYKKNQPFFDVPNYYGGQNIKKQITGNF